MTTHPESTTISSRRHRRWRRYASAVLAFTTLAGVHTAVNAAPASAAGPTAALRMAPGSRTCFTMTGHIPMGQYETHGYLNNGARLDVRAYGADVLDNDDFLGKVTGVTKATGPINGARLYASLRGIEFEWLTCGNPGSRLFWLNEDVPGSDEVYVQVIVRNGDGGLLASLYTNQVSGNFGF